MRFKGSYLFGVLVLLLVSSCSHKTQQNAVHPVFGVETVDRSRYLEKNRCKLDKHQYALIEESLTWLGTPYVYGGDAKGKGTDCSGMVLRVYLETLQVELPRNSAKQAEACKHVKKEHLKPGDLVFFATGKDSDRISHVGIMLTDEEFIHASSSKGVVISNLTTPYYIRTFKKGGRVKR